MICVAVTIHEPFRIKSASDAFLSLFEFSEEAVVGRTLRMLCGPETRVASLQTAIANSANAKETTAAVCLYSSAGRRIFVSVNAKPDGKLETCTLNLTPSSALSLKQALNCGDCPCVVVTVEKPHAIEDMNLALCDEFGMSEHFLPGKKLGVLHGPRTDCNVLGGLLHDASNGLLRTGEVVLYSSRCTERHCEVSVAPVLSKGIVTHVQVKFSRMAMQSSSPASDEEWSSPSFRSLRNENRCRSTASTPSAESAGTSEGKGAFLDFLTSSLPKTVSPSSKLVHSPVAASPSNAAAAKRARRWSTCTASSFSGAPSCSPLPAARQASSSLLKPRQPAAATAAAAAAAAAAATTRKPAPDSSAIASDLSRMAADIPAGDPRIAEMYAEAVKSLGGVVFIHRRQAKKSLTT
eukprot:1902593-Rhodomonas_salina.3